MKQKIYSKPTFKCVRIEWNDLCAGSNCTQINISVQKLRESKSKTYAFDKGETIDKGMWETSF